MKLECVAHILHLMGKFLLTHTAGSWLSQIFWEHENLPDLSVLIYTKLYKEKEKKWQKLWVKWESVLTAVWVKWDPPVYGYSMVNDIADFWQVCSIRGLYVDCIISAVGHRCVMFQDICSGAYAIIWNICIAVLLVTLLIALSCLISAHEVIGICGIWRDICLWHIFGNNVWSICCNCCYLVYMCKTVWSMCPFSIRAMWIIL